MKRSVSFACSTCALVASIAGAAAALPSHKVLTLEAAHAVIQTAIAEAKKANAGGAIAVVDDGGHLIALDRIDGTFSAASNIAIAKARSAANFKKPTSAFEDAIKNGRVALVANDELMPLQGGVPIVVDGQVVGAVGIAGANSAQQDDELARLAATAVKE